MNNTLENINKIIDYIEDNLTEEINLDTISEITHYSKYHFHRLFSNTINFTLHNYVQRRRLNEAAKLLVFTKRPIIDIALLSGYKSQQAFTTAFKLLYKKSPYAFRKSKEYYPLQLKFVFDNSKKTLLNKHNIILADYKHIKAWMDLVYIVKNDFPGLIVKDYIRLLKEHIYNKSALIIIKNSMAIGIMGFSYKNKSIDFLAVHPDYRQKGIAKAFLKKVINEFLKGSDITVTTYREGDKYGKTTRDMYKKLGFKNSKLLIEFGYPTEKLIKKSSI